MRAEPAHQERRRRLAPTHGWHYIRGAGGVRGPLVGGCLEVLNWVRGTRLWPAPATFDGAVLFLETSEEGVPASYLRRELRVYARMGILSRLSAILFGRPGGGVPIETFEAYDRAIFDVLDEEGLTDLALVTHMDFGHTDPMFVLPYGVTAEVDCDRRRFSILDSGVTD